jgi:glycosyltransferase involved in cell wall biosynthesis
VVAGGAAILVDPDDVEGLSTAMERLSFDDSLVARMRQLGFRRAAAFSWAESARALLSELQRAAGAGRPIE